MVAMKGGKEKKPRGIVVDVRKGGLQKDQPIRRKKTERNWQDVNLKRKKLKRAQEAD